jgi:superfamily I DNA/RNA helicase
VTAWQGEEVKRLDDLGRDFTAVTDKAACLLALAECKPTIAELLSHIDELFAVCDDDGVAHNFIELSSTHRAKGLEADVVWLLRDTFMVARWVPLVGEPFEGEKVWRKSTGAYVKRLGEEEGNLLYVGITRAKRELYYVCGEVGDGSGLPQKDAVSALESFFLQV